MGILSQHILCIRNLSAKIYKQWQFKKLQSLIVLTVCFKLLHVNYKFLSKSKQDRKRKS